MKRLLLIIVVLAMLLVACQTAPTEAPPETDENSSHEQEPQTATTPEPLESTDGSGTEQQEMETEIFSYEDWPARFSAFVESMGEEFGEGSFSFIRDFHLIDTTFDGTPELLVELRLPMGVGPHLLVLTPDSSFDVSNFHDDLVISGTPLRFFQNDHTEDVIFSSLFTSYGRWNIRYSFAESLVPFKQVECRGANNHHLLKFIDTHNWEIIEEFVATPDLQELVTCDCDIQLGRNASDSTIVHLVNMALEGFIEISAPPIYTFGGFGTTDDRPNDFSSEHMRDVQEWIFEVAENWSA